MMYGHSLTPTLGKWVFAVIGGSIFVELKVLRLIIPFTCMQKDVASVTFINLITRQYHWCYTVATCRVKPRKLICIFDIILWSIHYISPCRVVKVPGYKIYDCSSIHVILESVESVTASCHGKNLTKVCPNWLVIWVSALLEYHLKCCPTNIILNHVQ